MSNKQPISTFLVAGLAGTLFVSGAAHGDFLGISLVSKPDPQNPRLLICNLLLNFDYPADRWLAVNGCIPSLGDPQLFFSTNSSNGFHQELFMGGNRDFAVTAAELVTVPAMANDTYVNIGIKSGETTAGGIRSGTAADLSPTTPLAITFGWNAGGKSLFSNPITGGAFTTLFFPGTNDQNLPGTTPNGNSIFLSQLVIDTNRPTNDGGPARIDVQIANLIWTDGVSNFLEGFDPSAPPGQEGDPLTVSHVDCPTDTNGDGVTNVLDLIELLLCFGLPAVPGCDSEDVNADGTVNVLDLIDLLLAFGAACP